MLQASSNFEPRSQRTGPSNPQTHGHIFQVIKQPSSFTRILSPTCCVQRAKDQAWYKETALGSHYAGLLIFNPFLFFAREKRTGIFSAGTHAVQQGLQAQSCCCCFFPQIHQSEFSPLLLKLSWMNTPLETCTKYNQNGAIPSPTTFQMQSRIKVLLPDTIVIIGLMGVVLENSYASMGNLPLRIGQRDVESAMCWQRIGIPHFTPNTLMQMLKILVYCSVFVGYRKHFTLQQWSQSNLTWTYCKLRCLMSQN